MNKLRHLFAGGRMLAAVDASVTRLRYCVQLRLRGRLIWLEPGYWLGRTVRVVLGYFRFRWFLLGLELGLGLCLCLKPRTWVGLGQCGDLHLMSLNRVLHISLNMILFGHSLHLFLQHLYRFGLLTFRLLVWLLIWFIDGLAFGEDFCLVWLVAG
jgi:hypothetical protein